MVLVFVFDPKVGQRNLAVDDFESVSLGDLLLLVFLLIRGKSSKLCNISVKVFLQFKVEDNAEILSSLAFNSFGGLVIEAIERRVVSGLAWLHEALMERLVF
jgi:hypothetical protein